MQTLVQERWIPCRPEVLWTYLTDLRHFGRHDPFHHDFRFTSNQTTGLGAEFELRHTYLPIFPLPSDKVRCEVTTWLPGQRVTILERNRLRLKWHTQSFVIVSTDADRTLLRFIITYRGVPWILLPWRLWATWLVKKRMAEKLGEIERECAPFA